MQVLHFGTFWDIFPNIFGPHLVESIDVECVDMED